jgi:hypothetical protein
MGGRPTQGVVRGPSGQTDMAIGGAGCLRWLFHSVEQFQPEQTAMAMLTVSILVSTMAIAVRFLAMARPVACPRVCRFTSIVRRGLASGLNGFRSRLMATDDVPIFLSAA